MKRFWSWLVGMLLLALLCGVLCACKADLPGGETGLPPVDPAEEARLPSGEGSGQTGEDLRDGTSDGEGTKDGEGTQNSGQPVLPGGGTEIVLPEVPFNKGS